MQIRRKNLEVVLTATLCAAVSLSFGVPAALAEGLGSAVHIPERSRVCMMQDTVMAVPAIPLASGGKTYYGCCEMCKAKIAAEPVRYTLARDPVSGAVVDKATAALLSVDGQVLYFESEATRGRFVERLPPASPKFP